MEQHHLALLFDTFTDRVGDRKPVFKYQQGLDLSLYEAVSTRISLLQGFFGKVRH